MKYDRIIFVDFDGTITSEETMEGSLKLCVDPKLYSEKEQEMKNGGWTVAELLHYAFSNIPSSCMPKIMDYVRSVPIRPGFGKFLDTANELNIPVVILSGGLEPYITEKLAPYRDRLLDVYAVSVDLSGPTIGIRSDYEEGGELVAKAKIMAGYDYDWAACIGDHYTDVKMAAASSLVFARDLLAAILSKQGKEFVPWEDFYDVEAALRSRISR